MLSGTEKHNRNKVETWKKKLLSSKPRFSPATSWRLGSLANEDWPLSLLACSMMVPLFQQVRAVSVRRTMEA